MNELEVDELTEHLLQVLTVTPDWRDEDHAEQQVGLEIANALGLDPEDLGLSTTSRTYQARNLARQLGMELAVGPEHRVEIGGQVIYIWPLRPYGSRAPLALWFEHGWSKSWDWPERDSSATWNWSAW